MGKQSKLSSREAKEPDRALGVELWMMIEMSKS